MIEIIALDGRYMTIGKTYKVGADVASTLIKANKAKYADDSLNPKEKKTTPKKRRTTRKKTVKTEE